MDGTFALTVNLDADAKGKIVGTGLMALANGRAVALGVKGKTTAGVTALQLTGDKTANALFGAVKLKLTIETFSNGTGNILALSGSAFGQALQWP